MRSKSRNIALWALSTVLAVMFVMSGAGKLSNMETMEGMNYDEQFVHWGYPAWFRIPVGLLEIAGAAALFVPRLRFYAATGLTLLMIGATFTHIRLGEFAFTPFPLALAMLAAITAWLAQPPLVRVWLRRTAPT